VEKTYIIVTQLLRRAAVFKRIQKVKGILETLKEPAKVFFTEYPKHAMELAKTQSKKGPKGL